MPLSFLGVEGHKLTYTGAGAGGYMDELGLVHAYIFVGACLHIYIHDNTSLEGEKKKKRCFGGGGGGGGALCPILTCMAICS